MRMTFGEIWADAKISFLNQIWIRDNSYNSDQAYTTPDLTIGYSIDALRIEASAAQKHRPTNTADRMTVPTDTHTHTRCS